MDPTLCLSCYNWINYSEEWREGELEEEGFHQFIQRNGKSFELSRWLSPSAMATTIKKQRDSEKEETVTEIMHK
jgi:hypothetical protein